MKTVAMVILGMVVTFGPVSAQSFQWQATRNGWSSGSCQLVSDNIKITIYPFYADVEEDAVLAPTGTVWGADSSTLEMSGQFTMTNGASLRSMLLWDGKRILKAKLLDRAAADSAYEAIVDRDAPQGVARDPAEIVFLGNNTYQFKIYPVAINGSRKIRLLYSVPYTMIVDGPRFLVNTVFTFGASQTPSQIPVEIRKSSGVSGNYLLAYGPTKKTIQFGATYQITIDAFREDRIYNNGWGFWSVQAARPISVFPDTAMDATAFTATVDSGAARGNYAAVFATPPDSIRAVLHEYEAATPLSIEAQVSTGAKVYIADYDTQTGYLGIYLKSESEWDGAVYWRVFDSKGKDVFHCKKIYMPHSDTLSQKMLPFIWSAKYSLVEGSGNLGALFGFVDRRMTLLAREADTLSQLDRLLYEESGVPLLKPGEIIVKADDLPKAPRDNVIFEIGTGVLRVLMRGATAFAITVKADHRITVTFNAPPPSPIKAALFDIRGRVLETWNALRLSGASADLRLPAAAKGCLILRIYAGKEVLQKKFTVTH